MALPLPIGSRKARAIRFGSTIVGLPAWDASTSAIEK
jgi:hypothetical protein